MVINYLKLCMKIKKQYNKISARTAIYSDDFNGLRSTDTIGRTANSNKCDYKETLFRLITLVSAEKFK